MAIGYSSYRKLIPKLCTMPSLDFGKRVRALIPMAKGLVERRALLLGLTVLRTLTHSSQGTRRPELI